METLPTSSYTAYSENKGEKIAFCLNKTKEGNKLIVEEIKSTKTDLSNMEIDSRPEHLMQGKMYAYLYALKENLNSINVRLTYIYVDDYKTKSFNKRYNMSQLTKFFEKKTGQHFFTLNFQLSLTHLDF